jgi:aerobic-type carbon monoxide dehydrogenase small subunit (CoxS/CutS family)
MIATIAGIALVAMLFVVFGLLHPRHGCESGSCGACQGQCPLHQHVEGGKS